MFKLVARAALVTATVVTVVELLDRYGPKAEGQVRDWITNIKARRVVPEPAPQVQSNVDTTSYTQGTYPRHEH